MVYRFMLLTGNYRNASPSCCSSSFCCFDLFSSGFSAFCLMTSSALVCINNYLIFLSLVFSLPVILVTEFLYFISQFFATLANPFRMSCTNQNRRNVLTIELPATVETGAPIHSASAVVVHPVYGNVSRAISKFDIYQGVF